MTGAPAGSSLRRFWAWISTPPDELLADAARDGELMVARLRIFVAVVLLLAPVTGLLLAPDPTESAIGLGIALVFLAVAVTLAWIVRRTAYSAQVSMLSAIIDVSMVSLGLLTFLLAGHPLAASNSHVLFPCYFLALGASALRYDARVTVVAGAAAILEHLGLSWLDATTTRSRPGSLDTMSYGEFSWASQLGQALVLLAMTVVALELVRRAQRLRRLSTGDRLTGLFNRAYAEEYLGNEVLRTSRTGASLVVGMLDVDHFKTFNDTHGHAAGDAALRHVAAALRARLRRSDVIARFGGEEILIILPGTGLVRGMEKLEEIRVDIGLRPITLPRGGHAAVTVSIGVALIGVDGTTVNELLDMADARLYAAKNAGRNRVIGPPPG